MGESTGRLSRFASRRNRALTRPARMKRAAARQGKPVAQFIRETMAEKLRPARSQSRDPFAWMDGLAQTAIPILPAGLTKFFMAMHVLVDTRYSHCPQPAAQ